MEEVSIRDLAADPVLKLAEVLSWKGYIIVDPPLFFDLRETMIH
jgi:hypothetical protein